MTITLDLAPDIEARLLRQAAREGRNAEVIAQAVLRAGLEEQEDEATSPSPKTLAELFAGRTGVFNSEGKFNYSSNTGKAFTDLLPDLY